LKAELALPEKNFFREDFSRKGASAAAFLNGFSLRLCVFAPLRERFSVEHLSRKAA
jgi:hypothetical protein